MGVKYLKDGESFSFDPSFGFSGSVDTPTRGPGGPQPYAKGGMTKAPKAAVIVAAPAQPKISVTPEKAVGALRQAAAMGALAGAKAAGGARPAMRPALTPAIAPPPGGGMSPMGGAPAPMGMKRGGRRMAKGGRFDEGGPAMDEDDGKPLPKPKAPPPTKTSGRGNEPLPRPRPNVEDDYYPPGEAKGGKWIGKGISRPGRMKKLAKEHGVSVHQEMERDKHSSSPSLRSAANLGLRLTGGDLSPRKRKG